MNTTRSGDGRRERAPRARRAVIVRFVLAGAALLGIGAAATSAAWTDDANFSANASSASVQLKAWNAANSTCGATPPADASGDATNACWVDAPAGTPVSLNASFALTGLIPNSDGTDKVRATTLYLLNAGTAPLAVTATCTTSAGGLFAAPNPLRVAITSTTTACTSTPVTVAASLAPGRTQVALNVIVPKEWWTNNTYKGLAGSLTVTFLGTAVSA